MQIGIRLHDITPGTLEERVRIAHEQGFTCGHLALSKTVTEHSVENAALIPGYATYLRKMFASHDVDIAVLGCYLNLAHPDPAALQKITDKYIAHIRFASMLGCSVVGTETGAPNAEYRYEPACRSTEALNTFIKNLRPVIDCAEKFGVIFAIEPVWTHIAYDSKRALEVLKAIGSPNLQIILDPVNLLGIENYEDRDRIIAQAIEDLGDYTAVIHMKDFRIEDGKLLSTACGTGLMDYKRILSFAQTEKPYIQMTLEDTKPENAIAARNFLESYQI